jgi:hypothetical protein
MTNNQTALLLLGLPLVLSFACSGGQLLESDLTNRQGATAIEWRNCTSHYSTTTSSEGQFTFNPYGATAQDFDDTKFVREGAYEMTVGRFIFEFEHRFNTSCNIPQDGVFETRPCSKDIFVMSRKSDVSSPLEVGPNGETVHYAIAAYEDCLPWDAQCHQRNSTMRILREKHRNQKCIIANIR